MTEKSLIRHIKRTIKENPQISQKELGLHLLTFYKIKKLYPVLKSVGVNSRCLDQPAVCHLLKKLGLNTNKRRTGVDENIIAYILRKNPKMTNRQVNKYIYRLKGWPEPKNPYSGKTLKLLRRKLRIQPNRQGRWFGRRKIRRYNRKATAEYAIELFNDFMLFTKKAEEAKQKLKSVILKID